MAISQGPGSPALIAAADSPSIDAFGRFRVSNPVTIFDSKQVYDNGPLFWDEALETGAGITSAHSTNTASTVITSTDSTAGKYTRQTYQSFNYQPGKSQLILMTGVLQRSDGGTGVKRRIGIFNDNNGVFFEDREGTVGITIRSNVTGTPVDTHISQSDWNCDKMDGTGSSRVAVDWSKTHIFVIDFEWLGVGRVRVGVNIDGGTYYVHKFHHANVESKVYMSTPNLPLRYQMETTASSPASTMECICCSIQSEGGQNKLGALRHADSGSISGLATGTTYAVLGIRLKQGYIGETILMETISMISTTQNDQLHWELYFNPTVAGTFTYNDVTDSAVQVAVGSSSNTISNGFEIDGGYITTTIPVVNTIPNALKLGAAIDGTVDEIILTAKPITNNIAVQGSVTWRELS